jgi:hypothetical protein
MGQEGGGKARKSVPLMLPRLGSKTALPPGERTGGHRSGEHRPASEGTFSERRDAARCGLGATSLNYNLKKTSLALTFGSNSVKKKKPRK